MKTRRTCVTNPELAIVHDDEEETHTVTSSGRVVRTFASAAEAETLVYNLAEEDDDVDLETDTSRPAWVSAAEVAGLLIRNWTSPEAATTAARIFRGYYADKGVDVLRAAAAVEGVPAALAEVLLQVAGEPEEAS